MQNIFFCCFKRNNIYSLIYYSQRNYANKCTLQTAKQTQNTKIKKQTTTQKPNRIQSGLDITLILFFICFLHIFFFCIFIRDQNIKWIKKSQRELLLNKGGAKKITTDLFKYFICIFDILKKKNNKKYINYKPIRTKNLS